jgi:hypothetical protein
MPTVFGYQNVKDKDHWLASPKREEFLGPLGVTNIRTFVDPENPTRVGVLMDVPDMDAVMAAMETEAAADAMAYDGVLPETLVILVEGLARHSCLRECRWVTTTRPIEPTPVQLSAAQETFPHTRAFNRAASGWLRGDAAGALARRRRSGCGLRRPGHSQERLNLSSAWTSSSARCFQIPPVSQPR